MANVMICPSPQGKVCTTRVPDEASPEVISRLARGRQYAILDEALIPSDEIFRESWRGSFTGQDISGITVNMNVAKEIQRDRWRAVRKPILERLDIEYMRADEAGNAELKAEIAANKQALRDVTLTDLSGVSTIEELKAIWPPILDQ